MASKAKATKPKSKSKAAARTDGPAEGEDKALTWVEIAQRNEDIVAAKARGLSWSQIAASFDMGTTRCQEIVREYREANPTLRHHDPLDIVDELLEGYAADISELVMIGAEAKNDNSRVGAINSRAHIRGKITELLQAIGVLPNDLGQLHIEIDARFVAKQVLLVLNKHEVGPELKEDLLAALRGNPAETIEAGEVAAA
jgi:hypothetical protein